MSSNLKRKAIAALLVYLHTEDEAKDEDEMAGRKRKRRETRNWIRRREEKGFYTNSIRELLVEDTASCKEMMRMKYEDFLVILKLIEKDIIPHQISRGNPIVSPKALPGYL